MNQARWKSWPVWVSAAGLLFLVLTEVAGLAIDAVVWQKVLSAIGTVLIGFGILNNPTDKSNF